MPYTTPTIPDLVTELANALGDPTQTFWLDADLRRIITEALRTWNCYASYWRSRRQFPTVSGQHFYDLITLGLVTQPSDQADLLTDLCYDLVEPIPSFPADPFDSFPTTEQYRADQINTAALLALRQYQFDAGMVMTNEPDINTPADPAYTIQLNEAVCDVRSVVLKTVPGDQRSTLRRMDEYNAQNWTAGGALLNSGLPFAYSFIYPVSQPALRLIPPPNITGKVEIVSIRSSSFPPTDYQWAAKWKALSQLLNMDGQSRDSQRALYCRKRYDDAVKLASLVPSIGIGYINNRPCPVIAASEMDNWQPGWRNVSGTPTAIVVYGWNLLGLYPTPNSIVDVSLEMFTEAPIPANDTDVIQIAPEHLQAVIDYCMHLAVFKLGGAEFTNTTPQMESFFTAAMSYNQKLKAEAMNFWTQRDRAAKDKQRYNRRPQEPTSESLLGDIDPAAAVPVPQ